MKLVGAIYKVPEKELYSELNVFLHMCANKNTHSLGPQKLGPKLTPMLITIFLKIFLEIIPCNILFEF